MLSVAVTCFKVMSADEAFVVVKLISPEPVDLRVAALNPPIPVSVTAIPDADIAWKSK